MVEDDISSSASSPLMAGTIPFDAVEDDITPTSDLGAVRNSLVRGGTSVMGLVDELLPGFSPQATNSLKIVPPHLFGLFGTPKPAASFGQDVNQLATQTGLLDNAKPDTQIGRFAENVTENAAAAAPFGPLAMLINGVLGGSGGYVGESVAGPTGRSVGSFLGGVSPAAISKLGVVKEIGDQIGPTLSSLAPRVFGSAPLEAAVGRAITKNVDDLPALQQALKAENAFVGPRTQDVSLRAVDELTGSTGLGRITDAVDNALPQAGFSALDDERNLLRSEALLGNLKEGITDYKLSKNLEDAFSKGVDTFESTIETPLWAKLDKGQKVVADILDDDLKAAIDGITYNGVDPLRGKAAGITSLVQNAIKNQNGVLDIGQIQKLRQEVLAAGRSAKGILTPEGEMTRKTADELQKHLLNIVDQNANAGVLSKAVADDWKLARDATNLKFTKLSAQKEGTKALEKLALQGEELDNIALINEGRQSPDKLASHLEAAKLGGKQTYDQVRESYRQSFLSDLLGKQTAESAKNLKPNWNRVIEDNIDSWKQVFSSEELAKFKANKENLLSQASNAADRITIKNSATNTRGKIQERLNSEKGIAQFSNKIQAGSALLGGAAGATKGYESAETTSGGILRGLLGGVIGAAGGKALGGVATRASDSFDSLLIDALKNPRTTEKVLEAAKPSQFGQRLSAALVDAAKVSAVGIGNKALSNLTQKVLGSSAQSAQRQPDTDLTLKDDMTKTPAAEIREVEDMAINPIVSKFEGGQRLSAYPPPAKGSGVTVATGIDLGQRSLSELKDLGLDDQLVKKLTPYLGKKDEAAKSLLKSSPLKLSQDEADQLDSVIGDKIASAISSKYAKDTGQDLSELPEEARTVVESLAYNFGSDLDKKLPTLWGHVVNNDWQNVHDFLIKTKWKQPELTNRRKMEAALLKPLLNQVKA